MKNFKIFITILVVSLFIGINTTQAQEKGKKAKKEQVKKEKK